MHFFIFLALLLASIVAGLPTEKQCGLAKASCHSNCDDLHNNLNICLCGTPAEKVDRKCKDAAKAYIECAKKNCETPADRQFKSDRDPKRHIVVEGDSPGNHEVMRRSESAGNRAAKRYIIIQGDSPDDFEIV